MASPLNINLNLDQPNPRRRVVDVSLRTFVGVVTTQLWQWTQPQREFAPTCVIKVTTGGRGVS